jgi:FixJ family two-component response regulator
MMGNIDEGAVAFLHKPFNAADLLGLIQAAPTNTGEK